MIVKGKMCARAHGASADASTPVLWFCARLHERALSHASAYQPCIYIHTSSRAKLQTGNSNVWVLKTIISGGPCRALSRTRVWVCVCELEQNNQHFWQPPDSLRTPAHVWSALTERVWVYAYVCAVHPCVCVLVHTLHACICDKKNVVRTHAETTNKNPDRYERAHTRGHVSRISSRGRWQFSHVEEKIVRVCVCVCEKVIHAERYCMRTHAHTMKNNTPVYCAQ